MSWMASGEMALEIAASVRSGFRLRLSHECYSAWKPNMPSHVVLETLAASSAISNCRVSGHSNVGHHGINAVPFGVSVSEYVTLNCDTSCPWLERRRAGRLRSDATAAV